MSDQDVANVPPVEKMFQMITGLWVSQAVGALAALGIVDEIGDGALSGGEIAKRAGTDERATFRLLRACAAVGVLAHDAQDRFSLTPLGATLRADAPGGMRGFAIAQTAPGHWLPWGRFREAVRTGARQTSAALGDEIFGYYAKNPAEAGAFIGGMNALSALVGGEVARLVDTRGAAVAVDVGGAHGTLISALLRANPTLRGILFDLQFVTSGARGTLDAAGLGSRCEVVAGDFFQGVPAGGDLYLLKQIMHDWNDEQCVAILRNCARELRPGGRVVIVEMVIPDDGRPSAAQLMDLNMLVMLPGRERTAREYEQLLAAAELQMGPVRETLSPFQIIEATR